MKKHSFTTMATALAFLSLAACTGNTGSVTDNGITPPDEVLVDELNTVQDLVTYLETSGHTVVTGETMNEPVFGVNGTQLTVNGQQVQVFEFASEDAAEQATADISDDGSTIGTSQVEWVSEPHFYQDGNLVVLYIGTDERTLDALEDALGAQIAGTERDEDIDVDIFPGDDDDTSGSTGAVMDDQNNQ